jgi:heme oxygenase (mycobilin-producing)
MLTRIVKMTFIPEKVPEFLKVFNASKDKIRHFNGCEHLRLFSDKNNPAVLFTYSIWQSEEHLNNYRSSELFNVTWAATKILFADKAEAWSLKLEEEVG